MLKYKNADVVADMIKEKESDPASVRKNPDLPHRKATLHNLCVFKCV